MMPGLKNKVLVNRLSKMYVEMSETAFRLIAFL